MEETHKEERKILTDLAKMVVNSFYPDECRVVMSAIIREKGWIEDAKLAKALNLHDKLVRSALSVMTADLLLQSEERNEKIAHGRSTHTKHTKCYCINYRQLVHAVRYRLHKIEERLDQERDSKVNESIFVCPQPRCQRRYALRAD